MNRPWLVLLCLAAAIPALAVESVRDSVHNLSRTGPGQVKSPTSDDVCGFCHVPHSAAPAVPLWGHKLSSALYQVYSSDTLDGTAPQPDGASKLCLACHDGTIALGEVRGKRNDLGPLSPASKGFLGTDLSGTHPVSITVTAAFVDRNNQRDSGLQSVESMRTDIDGVRLDGEDKVQCTSCHDPHADIRYPTSGIHFWRKASFSEVCAVCHSL